MKQKYLDIKNDNDLKKFYRKLKWYKSHLYKDTFFVCNNDEIKDIIEALNIKKRYQRIAFIYDKACQQIDNKWAGKNICGFKNNRCMLQQFPKCKMKNGCCRRCIYQSFSGCPQKNLSCKFFYCSKVKEKYDILTYENINILRLYSWRQKIICKHNYFTHRNVFLTDLYLSSLVIFCIRVVIRYIFITDIIFKWKKEY